MTLHPVWKLQRFTIAVLIRRLQVLWKDRRAFWLLVALFVPAVAATIVWAIGNLFPELITPWLVLVVAQVSGALRHSARARKSVKHLLPRWYFWLIQAICVAGFLAILVVSLEGGAANVAESIFSGAIQDAAFILALLSLISTALPFFLRYVSSLVRRLGLGLGIRDLRLPAPRLYLLLVGTLFLWPWLYLFLTAPGDSRLVLAALLLAALLPPVLASHLLWKRSRTGLLAFLPQAFGWTAFLLALTWSDLALLPLILEEPPAGLLTLLGTAVLIILAAVGHWIYSRLRYSPVDEQIGKVGDEALSVQTDPDRYVDTSGHGAQLIRFIGRSDGGVIGLTGVRGAGKSALISHVLAQLGRKHLTLSMTAPIRHDPGMGFLMTVCRVVSRRVLDDVHRSLYGQSTQPGRALREILRRILIVSLVIAAAAISVLALVEGGFLFSESESDEPLAVSPIEACQFALQSELYRIESVLGQIDAVGLASPGEKNAQYLLVPGCRGELKLLQAGKRPTVDQLRRWKEDLRQDCPPGTFGSETTDEWTGYHSQDPTCGRYLDIIPLLHQGRIFNAELLGRDSSGGYLATNYLLQAFAEERDALLLDVPRLRHLRNLLMGHKRLLENALPRNTIESSTISETTSSTEMRALRYGKILLAVAALVFLGGIGWRVLISLARSIVNWRFVALAREAGQFLETLNYSENRETSGGIAWKWLSLSQSRSLQARDLTLPGLTARFVEFIQSARGHYNRKVILAIDELDKIHDPEMVKALLTEIKGALFTKGCYYLISISEDATRAFRQRLSSGRDIFESTFDEIIEIPRMSVAVASEMIDRRLEKTPREHRVPRSCWFVLGLFGGGIPREIVRHLRTVSMANPDASALEPRIVAADLLRVELRDWMARLGEIEVSGTETIALRGRAKRALASLGANSLETLACSQIWASLEGSLDLLDPERLRGSVSLIPIGEKQETPAQVLRYRALVDDIQACLRLMILVTVCELICAGEDAWVKFEERILDAYGTLADKPALAEDMLREIRSEIAPASPASP